MSRLETLWMHKMATKYPEIAEGTFVQAYIEIFGKEKKPFEPSKVEMNSFYVRKTNVVMDDFYGPTCDPNELLDE